MNYARIAVAAFAATLVYYVYGYLVEGLLIRRDFLPYSAVYRSADSVVRYFPLGILGTLIATFVIGIIYAKGYAGGSGAAEGARFGVLVGIFAVCAFVTTNFVILNIGPKLALKLAASAFFEWILVCTVVGMIYKPAASIAAR